MAWWHSIATKHCNAFLFPAETNAKLCVEWIHCGETFKMVQLLKQQSEKDPLNMHRQSQHIHQYQHLSLAPGSANTERDTKRRTICSQAQETMKTISQSRRRADGLHLKMATCTLEPWKMEKKNIQYINPQCSITWWNGNVALENANFKYDKQCNDVLLPKYWNPRPWEFSPQIWKSVMFFFFSMHWLLKKKNKDQCRHRNTCFIK